MIGSRSNTKQRGFTLVELMIVLILIGVFTAVIIGELRGTFEDALLRSTGRKLINVLNLAGSRSVSINHPHTVTIDTANRKFSIEARLHSDDAETGSPKARNVAIDEGELDSRITLEIRNPSEDAAVADEGELESDKEASAAISETITFYPDGTVDAREIVLRDRTGTELLLRINPVTGRVRLANGGRN
jgi:type II secretion system protein H